MARSRAKRRSTHKTKQAHAGGQRVAGGAPSKQALAGDIHTDVHNGAIARIEDSLMNPLAVDPNTLAPFAEQDLRRLAQTLGRTEPEQRSAALEQDEVGAEAVKAVGDARALIALLHAVWGQSDAGPVGDEPHGSVDTSRRAA